MYTIDQWMRDRSFAAAPGQEVSAEVYEEMFNCMPPERLPRETAARALEEFKIPVSAGFLMHTAAGTGGNCI